MQNKKLGIFDSGKGGEITADYLKQYFNYDIVLLKDEKNAPYGTKSKEELTKIINNNIQFLIKSNVDVIVCACNTAASFIDYMLTQTNLPIYEPITPTIESVKKSIKKNSTILLLATEYTIVSNIYQKNLNDYQVKALALSELVTMAECQIYDFDKVNDLVSKLGKQFDCVILGCTHFSYFYEFIEKIFSNSIIIDSNRELVEAIIKKR